jgi:hypothetical protein
MPKEFGLLTKAVDKGGHIDAPSNAQATAAAILRN